MFDSTFTSTILFNNKCFIGSNIPGRNIQKSLGLISMVTKGINGNVNKEITGLLNDFVSAAEKKGGDGIINVRFESGSYKQQGSGWVVSYILMYGEVVICDNSC